jgi:hypothetical protein
MVFVAPLLFVLALMVAAGSFPWKDAEARQRTPFALIMLAPPIAAVLWGIAFRVDPFSGAGRTNGPWVFEVLNWLFAASAAAPFALLPFLKGARWFVISSGLALFLTTTVAVMVASFGLSGRLF